MRSIATLTQLLKKKLFDLEFMRFLVVGCVNTCGGYIIYLAFIQVMDYAFAYSFSFVISVIVSYLLNSYFVFKESVSLKKLLVFPLVYIVQYISGLCIIYLSVEFLSVPVALAPLIVVIITLPVTFLMARFIVKQ